MRLPRGAATLALLTLGAGPAPSPVPGSEVVGVFDFQATLVEDGCGFLESGLEPTFSGTLSFDSADARAYLTFGSASHEGSLEGDRLLLEATAHRRLEEQCNCSFTLVERIEARASSDASGCETDGGPLAQARLPDGGLDIRQLCGTIRDEVTELDGDACSCSPCAAVWKLSGRRQ